MVATEQAAKRFFLVLLVASIALLGAILWPMATALFMGAVFAGFLWPLNLKLAARLGKKRGRPLAAGILTLGVIVLILGPLVGMSAFLISEASKGIHFISTTLRSEGVTGVVGKLPEPVRKVTEQLLARIPDESDEDVQDRLQKQVTAQTGKAAAAVGAAMSATGSVLFDSAMMLIALYFLLLEGEHFVDWIDDASPLKQGRLRELLAESKKVSYSVIVSTGITSAVQAVVALIGYLIASVPNPIFFSILTFFIAFVPAVGAGSVCLVAAALLFVTGHPYMALFLVIWGLVVVGLVDNVIKPFLIKGEVEMHGAVVFFALIGGLAAFGAVGLLLGPMGVALFLSLRRMYEREFAQAAPPSA